MTSLAIALRMRIRDRLAAAACVVLLAAMTIFFAVLTPDAARAQSADVDRYPHLWAPRQPTGPRILTVPQRLTPARRAPVAARPAEATRPPPRVAAAAERPAVEATTFILVLGDNLAEWLAFGLTRAFSDIPEIGVVDHSRLSSGLVRTDFHDWAARIPEILAAEARVDFIVMLAGSNDRQALRIGDATVEFREDRWREAYSQRVDEVMRAMRARGVPVFWVGAPPLRGARLSGDMAYLNDIYKARAEANGVAYVDVWNGFVDGEGAFAQFGPDFAGQVRRLRTNDGIHFTAAGARKLALFVEGDLRRMLVGRINPQRPAPDAPGPLDDAVAARPADPALNVPIPEAATPDLGAVGLVPQRVRPLAGPVLPLHGAPTGIERPAVTPAAATGPSPAPAAPQPTLELAGERPGQPPTPPRRDDPPAGRIDDFRWPRR